MLKEFLEKLERNNIYYSLDSVRKDYTMVNIVVPGERWEVEFEKNGRDIVVERFVSDGGIRDESALDYLFENFSD